MSEVRNRARAWRAADALHREAHDDWPLLHCTEPSCVALKDALSWSWREYREPGLAVAAG